MFTFIVALILVHMYVKHVQKKERKAQKRLQRQLEQEGVTFIVGKQ